MVIDFLFEAGGNPGNHLHSFFGVENSAEKWMGEERSAGTCATKRRCGLAAVEVAVLGELRGSDQTESFPELGVILSAALRYGELGSQGCENRHGYASLEDPRDEKSVAYFEPLTARHRSRGAYLFLPRSMSFASALIIGLEALVGM